MRSRYFRGTTQKSSLAEVTSSLTYALNHLLLTDRYNAGFNPGYVLDGELAYRLDEVAYDWLKTNGYPAQYAEEGVLLSIAGRDSPESHFATGASQERLQEIASWSRSPGVSWSKSLLEEPEEEAIPMDVEGAGCGTVLPCGATLTSYLIQDKTVI